MDTRKKNPRGKQGAVSGGSPTPIRITGRVRTLLVLGGLGSLAGLAYAAPAVPLVAAGGFALALSLSFPVRFLSRFVPRPVAILASFVLLALLALLVFSVLIPILADQLVALLLDFFRPRLRVKAKGS